MPYAGEEGGLLDLDWLLQLLDLPEHVLLEVIALIPKTARSMKAKELLEAAKPRSWPPLMCSTAAQLLVELLAALAHHMRLTH